MSGSSFEDKMQWWHFIVIVMVAILCIIGVVLWTTVGAVVTNAPDDNTCDMGWHLSHDVLIVFGFVFSILPILLAPTVPFIYTPLRRQVLVCCKRCGGESKSKHSPQPHGSGPVQLQEQHAVTSPNPLQQTDPEYEEVIELSENMAYKPVQSIEMKANAAYRFMGH